MNRELLHFLQKLNVSWKAEVGGFVSEEKKMVIYLLETDRCYLPDLEKINSLAGQGVRVITLWEDVWIRKKELVQQKIMGEILGRKVIFARKCALGKIIKEEADSFFEATHILGSARAKFRYGLFYKDQLVAAAVFSGGRKVEREGVFFRSFEWVRYASLPGIRVIGGMSKLLHAFVQEHHPDDVMSYADKEWSEGGAYQKLGFKRVGETPTQSYWLDPNTLQRYPRKRYPLPQPHWREVHGLGSWKFVKSCIFAKNL